MILSVVVNLHALVYSFLKGTVKLGTADYFPIRAAYFGAPLGVISYILGACVARRSREIFVRGSFLPLSDFDFSFLCFFTALLSLPLLCSTFDLCERPWWGLMGRGDKGVQLGDLLPIEKEILLDRLLAFHYFCLLPIIVSLFFQIKNIFSDSLTDTSSAAEPVPYTKCFLPEANMTVV